MSELILSRYSSINGVLYQLSYQAHLDLVTLWLRNIPLYGEENKRMFQSVSEDSSEQSIAHHRSRQLFRN